ncbi:dynamin family protein [Pelotomaculum isophthalicicum JI]|uniref:Dynamin family protein n=1 Tax=Pelotomaculum isophthalicicum JI TaxID=947010 RepID=A0A9X4GZA9_9FIRM|nr:dynamin family protein [Pelotomaculum isophthalicicum]MDF9408557.1 dynamin family protein [Pelotomaculum isophthalicicum JI]
MNELNRFIAKSEELYDLAGQNLKPAIAVIGSYNSGKSTLLNSLLGEEISPVGAVPTTSRLLYFDYADSFSARYTGVRDKCVFANRNALASFLSSRQPQGGRVNIELPAPILKKCRLIDTPGIDSFSHESIRMAEQAANESVKIIYLFHQRGIENFNRLFLNKFASTWKNKNLNDISFWLNCNLGNCDGTSLEATMAVLRKIFLSQVRLNAINILNHENIQDLRLFLEVELARYYFDNLAKNLKKVDNEIPAKLKKITSIADESLFLSEFWTVLETAEKLFSAYRTLNSIPLIVSETEGLLCSINSSNLNKTDNKAGGHLYRPHAGGFKEGKELILELLNSLIREKKLDGWLERPKLSKMAAKIKAERFTVVAAGGFSTGKSTFFNALMKEEILPTGNGPTTSSITRISHGREKTATVRLPLQVTLQIHENIGKQSHLCADKLDILENYIKNNESGLAYLEACTEDRFRQVDYQEITTLINQAREFYAAGAFARSAGKLPLPAVYKPVPAKGISRKKLLQKVRLTFHNAGEPEFDLANPAHLNKFKEITGPDNAFRISGIDIRHPSKYLELTDFVDTPGLDSIQKDYFDEITDNIRQCDAYLVFLNARHILNDMDKENFETVFLPQIRASFKQRDMLEKEFAKIYFVINFADTLTPFQQEAVTNFVRKSLSAPIQSSLAIPDPKIFLISALRGLAGKDRGMEVLLKNLEEGIMRFRGRNFYRNILDELYSMLNGISQKINIELPTLIQIGHRSGAKKQKLCQALEVLLKYRREIKNIRNTIYSLGRL